MVYGTGYTGSLIIDLALRRKLVPNKDSLILGARNREQASKVAKKFGLLSGTETPREFGEKVRVFALDAAADPAAIAPYLEDIFLVIHTAGPFSKTARPMLLACIRTRTHYIDITGEIEVFEFCRSMDAEAKKANILAVSGVGCDVVPTDCLAVRFDERKGDGQTESKELQK